MGAPIAIRSSELTDFPVRQELEFEARFRRYLEVRLAGRGQDRAARAADERADRGACATAGDAPDDSAETGATENLAGGLLTLAGRLGLRCGGRDRIDTAAHGDGVNLQLDEIAAVHTAALFHLGGHH